MTDQQMPTPEGATRELTPDELLQAFESVAHYPRLAVERAVRGTTLDLRPADARLIVHAVNHLPDYEAAVDALEDMIEAASALEARAIRSGGEFHTWYEERALTEARNEARAALDRLRGGGTST